ncbi:MAG: hypothetical protein MJZ24_09315 [Paludibacteraceae bacterium]|nr:hypothetical protein [Candidatus Physcocola equi]MCQ2234921.1 hypothetical protein [Paludibacteraceae bacterium]
MESYESNVKRVYAPVSSVYAMLHDMNNVDRIRTMIPASMAQEHADKMKILETMQCTEDTVSFEAPMVGRVGIRVVERQENSLLKFGADQSPLDFNLWIQMKETAPGESALKVTLKVDVPFMMKMMIGSKLKDGVEKVADMLARLPYVDLGARMV